MDKKIRVGIVGYGNLGRGVELAVKSNKDFLLKGIFTRRDSSTIKSCAEVIHFSKILDYKDEIDIMILCGGASSDLWKQGPMLASHFNTVDSFDNHSSIPKYFKTMDEVAKKSNKVSLISIGWDPGLFSFNRLLGQAIFPDGNCHTFWGKGVSQGHSEAIKNLEGVKDAIQYTIPSEKVIEKIRNGKSFHIKPNQSHKRVCYVVPHSFKDTQRIEEKIKNMPNYFLGYDTKVNFITEKKFNEKYNKKPHGGTVIATGKTGENNKQRIEFSLALENNPEFTARVLVAFARAVYKMASNNWRGAFSIFDIPFSYISPKPNEKLRKEIL